MGFTSLQISGAGNRKCQSRRIVGIEKIEILSPVFIGRTDVILRKRFAEISVFAHFHKVAIEVLGLRPIVAHLPGGAILHVEGQSWIQRQIVAARAAIPLDRINTTWLILETTAEENEFVVRIEITIAVHIVEQARDGNHLKICLVELIPLEASLEECDLIE